MTSAPLPRALYPLFPIIYPQLHPHNTGNRKNQWNWIKPQNPHVPMNGVDNYWTWCPELCEACTHTFWQMNDKFNSKKHTSIYHLLAEHNVSLIESITWHSRGTLLQSVHNDAHLTLHKDIISHCSALVNCTHRWLWWVCSLNTW